ncbi:hypothetical protein Golax_000999 [Gossypium laxum]|uniref:Uncharacterized protein n=1 Tax=Gossypium laxum TaxID=34288 RepID=A0A7J9AXG1_9ROSI|nr:hypothetical protein [Gossypium laxum]
MLSALERRVVNLEESVRDMRETLELVEGRTNGLDSMEEQLKNFVLEPFDSNVKKMKGILNSTMIKLVERDDALEAMVSALKEEIAELKRELTIYKAALSNGMLNLRLKQQAIDVPKPKKFKGARSTREVDNFLWEIKSIDEKCGGNVIGTSKEFQRKLKKQFYPQYIKNEARAKLCRLT